MPYVDYGYFAMTTTPSGNMLAVVAGTRDTGLKGLSHITASNDLDQFGLSEIAAQSQYEVLVEVTGEGNENLKETVLTVRPAE